MDRVSLHVYDTILVEKLMMSSLISCTASKPDLEIGSFKLSFIVSNGQHKPVLKIHSLNLERDIVRFE